MVQMYSSYGRIPLKEITIRVDLTKKHSVGNYVLTKHRFV